MDGMGLFRQQDKEGPTELYLANSGFHGQEAFFSHEQWHLVGVAALSAFN